MTMFQSQPSHRLVLVALFALLALTSTGIAFAGDSFTTMDTEGSLADKVGSSFLSPQADVHSRTPMVTFYNNQAAFTADAPGLTLEDFENGTAAPGAVVGCPSPLSNSTPGSCFPSGELVDGFSFNATTGVTVALGAGTVPLNPTTWVAADLFVAGSFFDFSDPDVFAVGFEVFSFGGVPMTVSVYGDGDALLGTIVVPPGGPFFGVKTDETITRVSVAAGAIAVYDNLQFGKGVIDTDGDGIADDDDACPNTDLAPTVVIDGCDSGVDNTLGADGCTISDLIGECADGVSNHGQFVSCVSHLTNDLKKAGLISGRDKGAIMSCAAQSDIP
jgi:hypothetical protein